MSERDGREFLVCTCGWVHLSALPGERGRADCVRCGKPASAMLVAPQSAVDALPDGVNINIAKWP